MLERKEHDTGACSCRVLAPDSRLLWQDCLFADICKAHSAVVVPRSHLDWQLHSDLEALADFDVGYINNRARVASDRAAVVFLVIVPGMVVDRRWSGLAAFAPSLSSEQTLCCAFNKSHLHLLHFSPPAEH